MSHATHSATILAPRSKFYQGRFGRICSDLEPWSPGQFKCEADLDKFLLDFANCEMIEVPGKTPGELSKNASITDLETKF